MMDILLQPIATFGAVLVGVILILWLRTCFVMTRQQHVRLIESFGKYASYRQAGLSLKLPWPFQQATENFSLQIQEIAEDVTVKSVDNAFVTVPIRVQYQVSEGDVSAAYYKLANPRDQIQSYVVNQVRSTASGQSFEDLFKSRDQFEDDVERTLTDKMASFGYRIHNVLVDDPQPSEGLQRSFERVLASQREKEAATNEGEAARIRAVAKANAEGEALEIKAKSWSQFRQTIAEGNAKALKDFVGETDLDPTEALSFFTAINEMEAVRDAAAAGGRVVFVGGSGYSAGGSAALMGMIADRPEHGDTRTVPRGAGETHSGGDRVPGGGAVDPATPSRPSHDNVS